MKNAEQEILLEKKLKREYDKMMADIEHNIEQKFHWKIQRFIWACGVVVAIAALTINAYFQTKGM